MGIVFGLFLLAVLIAGLLHRRREKKTWLREERYEESGAWVDKRAGERGTYGSLDAEREAERHALSRQGRINDLALDIRNYAFENIPDFHASSDSDIRDFAVFARSEAGRLFAVAEALLAGQPPEPSAGTDAGPYAKALKKRILDFMYEQYPKLLDLELDTIRLFDRHVAAIAGALAERMQKQ